MYRPLRMSLVILALVAGAGCTAEPPPKPTTLTADQASATAEAELRKEVPATPASGSMKCPGMTVEQAATVQCEWTQTSLTGTIAKVAMSLRVAKIEEGKPVLALQPSSHASYVGATAESVEKWLLRDKEWALSTVECPEIPGEQGKVVYCDAVDADGPLRVAITVDGVYRDYPDEIDIEYSAEAVY